MVSPAPACADIIEKLEAFRTRAHDEERWSGWRLKLGKSINSPQYDYAFAVLIFFNLIQIIALTDSEAANEPSALWVEYSSPILLAFYIIDCVVRIYVYRIGYFLDPMNVFDFCIVVADTSFTLLASAGVDGLPSISFLRIARLCRMRRVLVMFPKLKKLGASCLHAVSSIMWGMMILAMLVICWSILAVQFIHPLNQVAAEKGWYDGCLDCPMAFSTVMRACLTLFQQILAGDSWGQVSKPVIIEFPVAGFFFLAEWVTLGLALTNIILAAIVEAATDARAEHHAELAEELMREKHEAEASLMAMFKDMDGDCSGNLTLDEVTAAFTENGDFTQLMHRLDINVFDIQTIFEMLDADQSGEVSYTELLDSVVKLKAQSQDVKTMLHFFRYQMGDAVKRVTAELHATRQEIVKQLDGGSRDVTAVEKLYVKPEETDLSANLFSLAQEVSSSDFSAQQQMLAIETQLEASLANLRALLTHASLPGSLARGASAAAGDEIATSGSPVGSLPPPQPNVSANGAPDIRCSPSSQRAQDIRCSPSSEPSSRTSAASQIEGPQQQRPLPSRGLPPLTPPRTPASGDSRYASVTAFIQEQRASISKR
eukprot:TRINITY_DN14361_c0_g2_i3.p1 TRINITY_DN14361_c0_g2~~TRINITY_DN14361_c0_g2_i3.p1  ORF type:complete len:633 (+),score=140.90 TRINITY_DN14361_c0_g2_i3:104-1900(+)